MTSEAITEAAPAMDPAAAKHTNICNVDALPSIEAAPAEYPDPSTALTSSAPKYRLATENSLLDI